MINEEQLSELALKAMKECFIDKEIEYVPFTTNIKDIKQAIKLATAQNDLERVERCKDMIIISKCIDVVVEEIILPQLMEDSIQNHFVLLLEDGHKITIYL